MADTENSPSGQRLLAANFGQMSSPNSFVGQGQAVNTLGQKRVPKARRAVADHDLIDYTSQLSCDPVERRGELVFVIRVRHYRKDFQICRLLCTDSLPEHASGSRQSETATRQLRGCF